MPDGVILGKALGGGVLPVSAFVGKAELMDVFTPGSHGSTFGGNPLAAAVGLEALKVMDDEKLVERSRDLGAHMHKRLRAIKNPALKDVRGRGLWAGAEIDPRFASARDVCDRLLAKGVLSKDTHGTVVRLAPPLVIARADLDIALDLLRGNAQRRRVKSPTKSQEASSRRWHNRTQLKDGDMTENIQTAHPDVPPRPFRGGLRDQSLDARAGLAARRARAGRPVASRMGRLARDAVVPRRDASTSCRRWPAFRISSSRPMPRSCSTARPCWRAFAIRSAARRRAITRRRSAPCRRRASSIPFTPCRRASPTKARAIACSIRTRNLFWMGYGPRSDIAARRAIEDTFDVEALPLKLADPRFYHMDTALSALAQWRSHVCAGARSRRKAAP